MQNTKITEKLKEIETKIGNTKMLAIDFSINNIKRRVYAKCEFDNLSGSIKDRMALNIIKEGYESGKLKEDGHIIEATSGNTGIALSAIGQLLGHKVTIFMPDWLSVERRELIKKYGANIILVSREEGGFLASIKKAKDLAATDSKSFLSNQFTNQDNVLSHYKTTGPEIEKQILSKEKQLDAFVAGVGTGGVVMGVGKYFREISPNTKIHPLEPQNSPTLSTGHKVGKHRIEGISDEFIPEILKLNKLDNIIAVDDGDAICMAQKLSKELGLKLGISSGANFLGAVLAQNKLGDNAVVATIFTDNDEKYHSTDLFKEEPIKDNFISTNIKLIEVKEV